MKLRSILTVALLVGGLLQASPTAAQHKPEHHRTGHHERHEQRQNQQKHTNTDVVSGATEHHDVRPHRMTHEAKAIRPNTFCYLQRPGHGETFVVIDSIDNCIDIVTRGDSLQRTAHYQVDITKKRHDVSNILRPRSIQILGDKILFVACNAKDSSIVGVLNMQGELIASATFGCRLQAMQINGDELVVVGTNPLGYDIRILSLRNGVEHLSTQTAQAFHYHVPKQSERIREADPFGIGLSSVAIAVVFLALLCIVIIMYGYRKPLSRVQKENDEEKDKSQSVDQQVATPESSTDDVYVAIATALYLYNEELHDEEDDIITLHKTERAWTPWNAKFYNMNQYFNTKR